MFSASAHDGFRLSIVIDDEVVARTLADTCSGSGNYRLGEVAQALYDALSSVESTPDLADALSAFESAEREISTAKDRLDEILSTLRTIEEYASDAASEIEASSGDLEDAETSLDEVRTVLDR